MTFFARLFRLVWGGDVDRALRPVLAVSLVGSIAGASAYPFLGIWAIKELHAPQSTLAVAYLVGAVLAGVSGYVGGHLSDRVGRRPLILLGWGFQALVPLLLLSVGDHVYWGLTLLALLPVFGSLGGAADQAMVADLVAPERQEAAYAAVRVAANLGVTIGPVIGGLLLIGGHWSHLWLGTLVLSAAGFVIAFRYIPRGGAYAPAGPPQRGSFGVIIRDTPFLLFMLSSVFATMTYVATETLLPISVTTTPPSRSGRLGLLDDRQSAARHRVPAAVDALDGVRPLVAEAGDRNADDGRPVPAPERQRLGRGDLPRDRHLRRRRDALGADLTGSGRCTGTGRHQGRIHGRLQRHVVGGLGSDTVPRPAGAERVRRRDDVGVRRDRRRDRRPDGIRRRPRP